MAMFEFPTEEHTRCGFNGGILLIEATVVFAVIAALAVPLRMLWVL